MEWINRSATKVSRFLEGHRKVRRVYYPALPSHQQYDLAQRQMTGFGAVVTFEIDGTMTDAKAFIDTLKLCLIAASLGGAETLVVHPATMTYYKETPEQRRELGIGDELIRLSIGLEDPDDIIADLDQALARVGRSA